MTKRLALLKNKELPYWASTALTVLGAFLYFNASADLRAHLNPRFG